MAAKVSILVISLVVLLVSTTKASDFDVTKYGAKSDLSTALLAAWKEACACTTSSNVLIPKGNYKLSEVLLEGPCQAPITIKLCGTLLANPDPKAFKNNAWITINHVNKLTLEGGGIIDGQGLNAWKANQCSKNANCQPHPLNLGLNYLNDSIIQDVTSKDSKGFHINIISCQNTTLQRVTVVAPESSLNTDGIHLGRCDGLNIIDTNIKTASTQNVIKLACSPGHPCQGVEVADINLSYEGPEGSAISTCSNVKPSASGKVVPALCSAPAPA
ncbi:hypothetical protein ACFE04_029348 [Oxalis oulophora]